MLMRTDPFREFDRLTQQMFGGLTRASVMPMDAYRKDDWFFIHFDLPGVDADSIDLTVEQNVLTVTAARPDVEGDGFDYLITERPRGRFSRQLFLGESLDVDKMDADYSDGVLTVRIPVAEEAKPRRISIAKGGERREINA